MVSSSRQVISIGIESAEDAVRAGLLKDRFAPDSAARRCGGGERPVPPAEYRADRRMNGRGMRALADSGITAGGDGNADLRGNCERQR